jgi:hypothetical protein
MEETRCGDDDEAGIRKKKKGGLTLNGIQEFLRKVIRVFDILNLMILFMTAAAKSSE